MKKSSVPDNVIAGSACAALVDNARLARQAWADFHTSLLGCFISIGEPKQFVLDPFALLRLITQVRSQAMLVAQVGQALLTETERWARESAQSSTLAFDGELRKLCTQENVSVEGRFPSYLLEGFLIVRLSPQDRTCTVGDQKVKSLLVGRVWLDITSAVTEERLRASTPSDFLAACQAAYKRAILHRNAKMGASIPIGDIFRELVITLQPDKFWRSPERTNLCEYSKEYFCRDLARLMAAGRFVTPGGAKMGLLPTAFPKDGIPVMLAGGFRFIGHVTFDESSP